MDIELTKQAKKLTVDAEVMLAEAPTYQIACQVDYDKANEFIKNIKIKSKELEEERRKITIPLDEAKKKIMDLFRRPLEALQLAEKTIKDAILVFYRNEEEKRRQQEEHLRQVQEKEAEKLRMRAEKAEEKGQIEKAEDLKLQAEIKDTIVPVVEKTFEKAKGVSAKTVWHFAVEDIKSIPREYMIPNDKMLNDIATATKGTLLIPGVRFYSEEILAIRTR